MFTALLIDRSPSSTRNQIFMPQDENIVLDPKTAFIQDPRY